MYARASDVLWFDEASFGLDDMASAAQVSIARAKPSVSFPGHWKGVQSSTDGSGHGPDRGRPARSSEPPEPTMEEIIQSIRAVMGYAD